MWILGRHNCFANPRLLERCLSPANDFEHSIRRLKQPSSQEEKPRWAKISLEGLFAETLDFSDLVVPEEQSLPEYLPECHSIARRKSSQKFLLVEPHTW